MAIDKTRLGKLSEKYETDGRGCGMVSSGTGDYGGVSYGLYQFTSRAGASVLPFVNSTKWAGRFAGKKPGSPEFTLTWKEIAVESPDEFGEAQHDYVFEQYFAVCATKIKSDTGLDLSSRSRALQDVVWSTAVQHGPNNSIVKSAIDGRRPDQYSDATLIKAVYAERGRRAVDGTLVHFSKNSKQVQESVGNRFIKEESDALHLLEIESKQSETLKLNDSGKAVKELQQELQTVGISVPTHGKFDAATELGVKELQTAIGSEPSGAADRELRANAILATPLTVPARPGNRISPRADTGPQGRGGRTKKKRPDSGKQGRK